MRRPDRSSSGKTRAVLYAVPLIGVALVVAIIVAVQSPAANCGSASNVSPALDYKFYLQVEVYGKLTNGTIASQYVFPPTNVGLPGGVCKSAKLYDYGVNGRYPIYTLASDYQNQNQYPEYTIIHVTSSVSRTYLLSDFFAVWGETFGQNNTIGLTVPPTSNRFPSDWWWGFWLSCTPPQPGNWVSQPVSGGMLIGLYYGNSTYQC